MVLTLRFALILIALVIELIAAFWTPTPARPGLVPLGLAFFFAASLVP